LARLRYVSLFCVVQIAFLPFLSFDLYAQSAPHPNQIIPDGRTQTNLLDAYIFSDWGAVYSTVPAVVELNSVGVGASYTPTPPLTFEASYATPLKFALPTQRHYEAYGRFIFRPLLLWPLPG
jgi:hypothetical protein